MGTLMPGAAPATMPKVQIPPTTITRLVGLERRPTPPVRVLRTQIVRATARTMPRGQERQLRATPMVGVRRIPPVREHRQRTPTVGAPTTPKVPERRLHRA